MSRTDKDKPLHARATWWEPDHWLCPDDIPRPWRVPGWPRTCNLPPYPDPSSYDRTSRRRKGCLWKPVWDRLPYGRGGAPHWYTVTTFHDPQRCKVRDFTRRAVAEYRATREVDVIEPDGRGRNSAGWDYW